MARLIVLTGHDVQGGGRLDLLEMRSETGPLDNDFLDESRFAVISKRLISPTLVKTIRFSRLKITRSLIVSSNEAGCVLRHAGCAFTPLPPAVLPFLALDISFSILFKKGREKDSFCSKRKDFIKYPK